MSKLIILIKRLLGIAEQDVESIVSGLSGLVKKLEAHADLKALAHDVAHEAIAEANDVYSWAVHEATVIRDEAVRDADAVKIAALAEVVKAKAVADKIRALVS